LESWGLRIFFFAPSLEDISSSMVVTKVFIGSLIETRSPIYVFLPAESVDKINLRERSI
jgi:hypothetical protein